MRKVVIIGANGQLGTDLVKELDGKRTADSRGPAEF